MIISVYQNNFFSPWRLRGIHVCLFRDPTNPYRLKIFFKIDFKLHRANFPIEPYTPD